MCRSPDLDFLVTNWHVFAGRDSVTGKLLSPTGAEPDAVEIIHNARALGRSIQVVEPLWGPDDPDEFDRVPRWTGHLGGPEVDVAVLPLTQSDGVTLYPYSLSSPGDPEVVIEVTSDVAVVGFPFGLTHSKKFAIWTRGVVATEYGVDYDERPCFLIDSRTRKGQSGSPVIYFNDGRGNIRHRGGGFSVGYGPVTQFLGIYSGRINEDSDIGYVWRSVAIAETISAAVARAKAWNASRRAVARATNSCCRRQGSTWPPGSSLASGVDETVAGGAGLDDVAAECEAVDDGDAEAWFGEGFGPAAEASSLAIAIAFCSSRSVRTWKSSPPPLPSSSM